MIGLGVATTPLAAELMLEMIADCRVELLADSGVVAVADGVEAVVESSAGMVGN